MKSEQQTLVRLVRLAEESCGFAKYTFVHIKKFNKMFNIFEKSQSQ